MRSILFVIVMLTLTTRATLPAHAHATAPSSASLYQLTMQWTDQNDAPFRFADLDHHPTLVVMFYGSCRFACPRLLGSAKAFEDALTPAERSNLRVVFVTYDPEVDTAEALRSLATSAQLDQSRWRFLRGSNSDIRVLANVLGVRFRRLDNGQFSHSNILTLLNSKGEILHQVEGLNQPPGELVSHLRASQAQR